jgi:hypothetical protein
VSQRTHRHQETASSPRHAYVPPVVMDADLTHPIPDIAEAVTYTRDDGRREMMRVKGWYHLRPVERPSCDVTNEVIRGAGDAVGFTLAPCARDQATVLGLAGIAGALVRVDSPQLVREGRYVQWPKSHIDEARTQWLTFHCTREGLGRGYRDTLERLFPGTDFSYPH